MLRASLLRFRSKPAVHTKSSLRSLRHQLTNLKAANAVAAAQLAERRRLVALLQRHRWQQQQQQQPEHQHGGAESPGGDGSGPSASASGFAEAALEAARALHRDAVKLLPRNEALESAIAFALRENRDARTELEFIRQLLGSTLLSLASPVGPWDPYDVKPQVFALDQYLALPVFTSLEHLALFCRRFGFTARDPSGVLWADGRGQQGGTDHTQLLIPPRSPDGVDRDDALTRSMWWEKEKRGQARDQGDAKAVPATGGDADRGGPAALPSQPAAIGLDAADLFEDLGDTTPIAAPSPLPLRTPPAAASSQRPEKPRKTRRKGVKRRKPGRAAAAGRGPAQGTRAEEEAEEREKEADAAAKRTFWESVAQVSPFCFRQATPLPTFGPFVFPFFIGYFADVNTLLHNAAIVPEKVDIVLNPTSPTEFVLAREATDRILHRDQLLLLAYQRVERQLQKEFSSFFHRYCPEVHYAKSACIPRPLDRRAVEGALKATREFSHAENPLQEQRVRTQVLRESSYTGDVQYEIAILIQSSDLPSTYRCLQWGKEHCLLMGHPDLDLLPEDAAAPHVVEASQVFYDASSGVSSSSQSSSVCAGFSVERQAGGTEADSDAAFLGMFRKVGESQTVNVSQPADSYFHDPTNAYTEAHAVFTEELKIKRGQR